VFHSSSVYVRSSKNGSLFHHGGRNVKTSNIPEMFSSVENRKYNLKKIFLS